MLIPVGILIFMLSYVPLFGIVIAFQDYVPGAPLFSLKANWVGFDNGFPVPIIFALLLNEINRKRFKKVVQTMSYLPHFISTVVVAGIVLSFIGSDGLVNDITALFGMEPVAYNLSIEAFPVIYVIVNIWKSFGWNSILYLSSMSSIDVTLYESAKMDGANRLQMARYITIPGIMPTIAFTLIMSAGSILSTNTDMILLLYNPSIYESADVLGTYVYRDGLMGGNFSFGTAVSLFSTCLNFLIMFITNKISSKMTGNGLW